MRWSLRRRLAVAAAAATSVLLISVGLIGLTEAWRRSNTERLRDIVDFADEIERDLTDGVPLDDVVSSEDDFVALLDGGGRLVAATIEVDGAALERHADDVLEVPTLEAGDVAFDERFGPWTTAGLRCFEPDVCDTIVVGRRERSWLRFVTASLPWGVPVVLASAAVAAVGARALVGRSLEPVERMGRELDEITDADLERRVSVPTSDDELARLATTMNATVDRLAASLAAQRRFVSDSAHELRSPLAGLRATLELSQADPSRTQQAVADAIAEIDRASTLVEDLLDLARQDGGARRDQRIADVDDLVRAELRGFERRWPAIRLQRDRVEPIQTRLDPQAMARVLRNLLDNAGAHASSTVAIALTSAGAEWRFRVDDDGPGVPVEHREEIFERFRRLDESRSRRTGGTGLGLAIAAAIVHDHGGHIEVGDNDRGGARFVVVVPRQG